MFKDATMSKNVFTSRQSICQNFHCVFNHFVFNQRSVFSKSNNNKAITNDTLVFMLLLLFLHDPFRGMGAWRKTMEPQKPGNSPGPGPVVIDRQRVTKEQAVQRVHSWIVQNEMRGVLGWVSAGAEQRIFDCAYPKEIRV